MSDEGEKSSWLEPLPEEYAADGDMTGRRMVVAALTVVVLAIFGGIVWYSYLEGSDSGPVPVVRADKSVVKEKPENPGGLEVPDQDKKVFVRVDSDQTENEESLAPSAEIPVSRPVDHEAIEAAKKEGVKAIKAAEEVILPPGTGTKTATSDPVKKPDGATERVAAIAPASKGKPSLQAGKYFVQLGAFGKKTTAENLWQKLKTQNAALLGDLSSDIVMVDLGKKGVLYRLRGGMVADRSSADKICTDLKAKKQACIVVEK